jgi:hypothetical protein
MAFDPDNYLEKNRSSFDPDAYLAKPPKADKPEANLGRMAQTALESYGNTATLGYLPHLQAAAEKLVPDPRKQVDEELLKKGFTITTPQEGYVQSRDANIRRLQQLRAENPKAALVGDVAGIAGNTLISGSIGKAVGKGLSAARPGLDGLLGARMVGPATKAQAGVSALKGAAAAGGAIGALANPGDIEGEFSPLQPMQRAENAGLGLAIGVAAQGATEGASRLGKGISDYLRGKAGEKAAAAIGATKADMKRLGEKGAEKLGREALDEGLVGPFSTPASIAKNAEAKLEAAGERIGALIKSADEAGAPKIDGAKMAVELLDDPDIVLAATTPGSEGMAAAAAKSAESLAASGELTLAKAHQLRRGIDKNINFNRKRMDLKPGEAED